MTQALLPALVAGLVGSAVALLKVGAADEKSANVLAMVFLPPAWIALYGCGDPRLEPVLRLLQPRLKRPSM